MQIDCQPATVNTFDLPVCETREKEEEALRAIWDNGFLIEYDNYCSQCLEPCQELIYNFEVNLIFTSVEVHRINTQIKSIEPGEKTEIRLNAEHFKIVGTEENLVYTVQNLLVSAGGYLGLFVGLSLLDIFAFLIDVCQRIQKRK